MRAPDGSGRHSRRLVPQRVTHPIPEPTTTVAGRRRSPAIDAMDDALLIRDLSGRVVRSSLGTCALLGHRAKAAEADHPARLTRATGSWFPVRKALARATAAACASISAKRGDNAARSGGDPGQAYRARGGAIPARRRERHPRAWGGIRTAAPRRTTATGRSRARFPRRRSSSAGHDLRLVLLGGPGSVRGQLLQSRMGGRTIF